MATAVLGTRLNPAGSVSIDTGVNLDTNGLSGDATPFPRRQIGPPLLSHDFLGALNAAGVVAQSIVSVGNVQDMARAALLRFRAGKWRRPGPQYEYGPPTRSDD